MSVFEKFIRKYGQSVDSNSVMRPPAPELDEEVEEVVLPKAAPAPVIQEEDPEALANRFMIFDAEKAEKKRELREMLEKLQESNTQLATPSSSEDVPTMVGKRANLLLKACTEYHRRATSK